MSSNRPLEQIPIVAIGPRQTSTFHWRRRAVQVLTLVIAVLIPLTGLLRIDPVAGAFVVLDRQVWWSDFFLIFGLWLSLASSLVLMYSLLGTAFCGWSCPQNTLSELANRWTYKLLGKRADVSIAGEKMKVASSKNKWFNWAILGGMLLAVSMLIALIPLFYFYPPQVIWSFITFQDDARLASSLHYIYSIFVLVILVDISFIRHFWCRFMCIYKVWQHGFKTRQTLHVSYDSSRSSSCEKCNYCKTSCFLGIDPRKTDIYDSCINCGECIDACNALQAKNSEEGLLRFEIGERRKSGGSLLGGFATNLASFSARLNWTVPFALLGIGMFIWGLVGYQHYHLAVYRADAEHGVSIRDYRVAISNKLYHPASLNVSLEGLSKESYRLSESHVVFSTAGRIDLMLHIESNLPAGVHSFIVHVESEDGWRDSYRVQHFVEKVQS